MNSLLRAAATAFLLFATLNAPAASAACDPRLLAADTTFPHESQRRGQSGTVVVDLVIDEDGRARAAQLHESSGYKLLDRAATQAALQHWQFDVSHCARSDLPASHRVAVEYRDSER